MTQSQVQQEGGPSPALLRTIESGRARSMSRSKRRDLERVLGWRLGSVDDILAGGEPADASEPVEIQGIQQHLGPDGKPVGYEAANKPGEFDLMKFMGLAIVANALSEAASDLADGEGSQERLISLAHKTHSATIELLAEVLNMDIDRARETARQMGYRLGDLSGNPST